MKKKKKRKYSFKIISTYLFINYKIIIYKKKTNVNSFSNFFPSTNFILSERPKRKKKKKNKFQQKNKTSNRLLDFTLQRFQTRSTLYSPHLCDSGSIRTIYSSLQKSSIVPENRRSPIHLFAIIIIPCVSRKSRNLFTRDAQPSMLISWYAFLFYMLSLPLPPIIPVIILFSLSLPLSLANTHIHTHTHSLINSNSKCYNKIRIRIRIVRNLNSISVRTIIQIEEPRVLMHAHKLLLLLLFKFHSLIAILLRAQFEDRALRQGWHREGVSWLVPWRYSGCASCDIQIPSDESYPSGMNLFSSSFSFSFCYFSSF